MTAFVMGLRKLTDFGKKKRQNRDKPVLL